LNDTDQQLFNLFENIVGVRLF